ncbi:prepilin-type N-terminal cleavage/methylation domain-containing protein [Pandoraea nosoerga]|nr:prepilin-type N-terminal cleavage/methylation domain-containing protein [Pandoraea nosoerga]
MPHATTGARPFGHKSPLSPQTKSLESRRSFSQLHNRNPDMNVHAAVSENAKSGTTLTPRLMQRLRRRRQRGVTLVELSVAVAVMGLIMAGAMVGVPRLMNGVKLSQEMKDWQMVVLAVQNAVASGTLTSSTSTGDLLKMAVTEPFNRTDNGSKLLNRFGGEIVMKAVDGTTYPASGVEVKSVSYPSAQCVEFAGKMGNLFATLSINGTELKSNTRALDMTQITDACSKRAPQGGGAPTDVPQADLEFTIAG